MSSWFLFSLFLMSLVTKSYSDTQCPIVSTPGIDRRPHQNKLRIVQYNTEWLFIDHYNASDCPGDGCTWKNSTEAETHLREVQSVIKSLNPDIINICEIEGCDELNKLISGLSSEYRPYLIKGKDTSTGQNVGMLTKIDPVHDLYRTEERITYPISGSTCGYTGTPVETGVSKHYITEFKIDGMNVLLIGVHLIAFPTDPMRCAEREAQASILQKVVINYVKKGYEIIIMGDFNDFDEDPLDANDNKPISKVLDILRGKNSGDVYSLENAAAKLAKSERYTDWWDKNKDCKSSMTEFSMIDHILLSPGLVNKISSVWVYHGYSEFCGKYDSDHFPVVVDFILSTNN
jgi:exonuclease III